MGFIQRVKSKVRGSVDAEYHARVEKAKAWYLDLIPKTRARLDQLYTDCDQLLAQNKADQDFLKTKAVEHAHKLAKQQMEDWLYLPYMAYIYFTCRIIKPNLVMETGVERGASTYTILTAFARNNTPKAFLHSFDLTPEVLRMLNVGIAPVIPREFYSKMAAQHKHHYGYSKDVIPPVLGSLNGQQFDLIIAGSDHRYENQSFEIKSAWPHLRSGGICLVDRPDIEDNDYRAWNEFQEFKPTWTALMPEALEESTMKFGVMIKR
jgi:predicted O-methyltransferase YrrM